MKYSNFKIGDKVTPGYLNGNNKNFTYGKVYDVINVYHSDNFNHITIRNDKNKSQILNDFGSTFFAQYRPLKDFINRFDKYSLADLATAKEYCILLLRRNTPH